jgi:type III pantothenate kinase
MLLAVDIGNSSIKFGVYDGDRLAKHFQIITDRSYSLATMRSAIGSGPGHKIERAIVCSVVPELDPTLKELCLADLGCEPRFVTNDWDLGLDVDYQPLSAAGTDRLINSFSAVEKYGLPAIVCSFGTALTIDVIDKNRRLLGGLIAPGIKPLVRALHLATSQLPEIEIIKPERVIQQNTKGSIQSGIVNGYLSMFAGLLRGVRAEIEGSPRVIATGGSAAFVAEQTALVDILDPYLTLDGLQILADRIEI